MLKLTSNDWSIPILLPRIRIDRQISIRIPRLKNYDCIVRSTAAVAIYFNHVTSGGKIAMGFSQRSCLIQESALIFADKLSSSADIAIRFSMFRTVQQRSVAHLSRWQLQSISAGHSVNFVTVFLICLSICYYTTVLIIDPSLLITLLYLTELQSLASD